MSEVTLEGDVDASTLENDATIVVSYDGDNYKIVKTPAAHGRTAADPLSAAKAYAIGSSSDNYYVKGAVSKITTPYNSAYGNMSFDVDCGDGTLLRFYNASVTEEQAALFATKGAIAIGFGKLAIYGAIHEINGTTIVDGYMPTTHSIIEVSGSSSVFVGETTQLSAKSYPESLGEPRTYTRSTSDANIATVSENGLVTGVSEGEVKITVSSVSVSKTYTILVSANTHGLIASDPLSAEEANEIAAGLPVGTSTTSFYYIEGVVTRVTSAWNSQYGNVTFYIQIGTGSEEFYVYRCYCDEATGTAIQAGSRVLIYSKLQNYRGTPETVQAGSNCVII